MQTDTETWMPEARGLAAQCWCDEKNRGKEMDADIAESAARRIAAWMETAAFHARNEEYWRKRAETAEGARYPTCAEEPNDRVEGRDAALSRRVPSHDGLEG